MCLTSGLSTSILVKYLEVYPEEEPSREFILVQPLLYYLYNTLYAPLQFSSISIRQVHCSSWITQPYYYFGTENIIQIKTINRKQNSKRHRPGEVTKVYSEEASACGQECCWKGCVYPSKLFMMTAEHSSHSGSINRGNNPQANKAAANIQGE